MAFNKITKLVVSREISQQFDKLKEEDKQKVSVFLIRFRMGSKVTLEPLQGASEYFMAPITEEIVMVLKKVGQVYITMCVGQRKDALEWAKTHCCEVNPHTRTVQLYQVASSEQEKKDQSKPAIFDALTDEALLEIGLPDERLKIVRAVTEPEGLTRIQAQLPERVYEMLTWFVQGEPWEKIVDTFREDSSDSQALVETEAGRLDAGQFRIVESDEELRDIMDKPLAQWRVFLHPSQRKLVERRWHGATRITGGAGTGKTVVALHRAKHLVELPDWKPNDRLLFTTFTRNLAVDIESQLRSIVSREHMNRITVLNIDAWLATFLRQHGSAKKIVYPGKHGSIYERAWKMALVMKPLEYDFTDDFYRDEWEEVVLPLHCHTSKDYMFADRSGRGVALTRMQRKAIWPIFEEMRVQLNLFDAMAVEDASELAIELIQKTYPKGLFRAVVCDEIQDFKPDTLRLLRALTPDISKQDPYEEGDLFLVGDAHQRIYAKPVSFTSCGIEIRGRSRKLRVNYRTTDEIRCMAETVYHGKTVDNMEGGDDEKTGYAALRHGPQPIVHQAENVGEECDWIIKEIQALRRGERAYADSEICITVRTNEQLELYEKLLMGKKLQVRRISRDSADDPDLPGVRLSTMHRIKGLEYKVVFVAGMNEGIFPLELKSDQERDKVTLRQLRRAEEALYYVACSRAADVLFLSCSGEPGDFIRKA